MKIKTLPIPVAIVGLGRAGWDIHLKSLLKHPGFKVVEVADPVPERTREAVDLTGCRAFASIDDLLEETQAELVVVATPSATHYADTVKVLEAGRHCILEKPMALNYGDAQKMVALANRNDLGLFVNHSHLHMPVYPRLKEAIDSGVLGPIFHLRTFWGHYRRRSDWQALKKNGGGQLHNVCSHILSMALPLLGGPVEEVYADISNVKDAGDAEDHVHLVLRAGNGVTADIVASAAVGLDTQEWMLCGKYGTLTSRGRAIRSCYYDPARMPAVAVLDEAAAPGRKYTTEEIPWVEKQFEAQGPVQSFHANVFEALTQGMPPMATPESAAEVVRVIEAARRAGQRPRPVREALQTTG